MTTIKLLALAALAVPLAVKAQQNPQPVQLPQPSQTQITTQQITPPCGKLPAPPPRKPTWFDRKAAALCQQNRNFCDLPSSKGDVTGQPPRPMPCPANTAPNPPTTKPPAIPAPISPAGAVTLGSSKRVYVCPPNSKLITGYPLCVYADYSVVDAIPLPSNLSTPAPPAFAAPAAQH
jgi:hypothetical protein